MPKPPNIIPSRQLNLALSLPLFTRLSLMLNSDLEGRVPHGAYSRFITELLRTHFEERELDVTPFIDAEAPAEIYKVRGDPVTLELLRRRLA